MVSNLEDMFINNEDINDYFYTFNILNDNVVDNINSFCILNDIKNITKKIYKNCLNINPYENIDDLDYNYISFLYNITDILFKKSYNYDLINNSNYVLIHNIIYYNEIYNYLKNLSIFENITYSDIILLYFNNNNIIVNYELINNHHYNELKNIENNIKKYYINVFNITYNINFNKEKLKLYIIACILKILIFNKYIDNTLCIYMNNIKKLIFLYNII